MERKEPGNQEGCGELSDPPAVADWHSDWLYQLVFREVEDAWKWCRRVPNSKAWQYVLVEEWSAARDSMCSGRLVRAWVRDSDGLREISLEEHKQHKRKIHSRIYPFVIVSFHIRPDRRKVVLGRREANTAGRGCGYLVEGEGETARLVRDPAAGFWIS
jgi:hypothetical protein